MKNAKLYEDKDHVSKVEKAFVLPDDRKHFFVDKVNYGTAYPEIRRSVDFEAVYVHIPYYSKKMNIKGSYLTCYIVSAAMLDRLYSEVFGPDFRKDVDFGNCGVERYVDIDSVELDFWEVK